MKHNLKQELKGVILMILNSDLILYHPLWEKADNLFCNKDGIGLFARLIDIYIVACSIGIREDKMINNIEEPLESPKSIGRNTYMSMQNNDLNESLTFMLQNALINSNNFDLDIDERLKLAFDPDYNSSKLSAANILNGFANYGIEQIFRNVTSESSLAAIDQMYKYLQSLSGYNYEQLLNNITLELLNESISN